MRTFLRNRRMVAAIALLAILLGGKWFYEYQRIGRLRRIIEHRFANEIRLIEQAAREIPPKTDMKDWDDFDKRDLAMAKLRQSLDVKGIVGASRTQDGHHGSENLRTWAIEGAYGPSFISNSADGIHTLHAGKTYNGDPVVTYIAWLRDVPYRHYLITFLVSELEKNE